MKTYAIRNNGREIGEYIGSDEADAYLDLCDEVGHTPERDDEGVVIIPPGFSVVELHEGDIIKVQDTAVVPPPTGDDDYPY